MIIHTDGGSRGNPGPAAYGFVVRDKGQIVKESCGYIGVATNNFAEYTAVVEAMKFLEGSHKGAKLEFFLDSQLVVSQLNGIYKVKNATIRDIIIEIRQLESQFKGVSYSHISREQNKDADRLVNVALDKANLIWNS